MWETSVNRWIFASFPTVRTFVCSVIWHPLAPLSTAVNQCPMVPSANYYRYIHNKHMHTRLNGGAGRSKVDAGGGGGCIFYSAVNLVIIASEISIFFLMSARYCWYFSEHCSHLNAIYYRIAYCWTIKNEIKKKMIMADVKLFIWWASSGIDSMLSSRKLKCTGLMFINSD